jgi:hypothetical protein
MFPADSECRVSQENMNAMIGKYAKRKGTSRGTQVMLFAVGWLLLAVIALPSPSGFL